MKAVKVIEEKSTLDTEDLYRVNQHHIVIPPGNTYRQLFKCYHKSTQHPAFRDKHTSIHYSKNWNRKL